MRLIVKDKEPAEWTAFRLTPGADYESKPCLRHALYKEQGGICAYCMRRLDNELKDDVATSNRIEHIQNREKHDDLKLVYTNMVMCCSGLMQDKKLDHVFYDRKKGNNNIHFSPLDATFIHSLSYDRSKGKIFSTDKLWQEEINSVLNLNDRLLMANRASALKAIKRKLGGRAQWKASDIKKMIDFYDNRSVDNLYQPFSGMIVWYLKNKLKANGISIS